jgi:bacterioferritin-associated ferredoxin
MGTLKKTARAEIPDREWIELEANIDESGVIQSVSFRAWGCHHLIETGAEAVKQFTNANLKDLKWDGSDHWNLLLSEVILRLQDQFTLPIADDELCHCRKIPTQKVDNAIVLGAQTPEKVRAWTSASSGCGTCRPNVEKLISYRLKKSS